MNELKVGSHGASVRSWQLFLVSQGIQLDQFSNLGDGTFGVGTKKGTEAYQTTKGLPVTGVVDFVTQSQAIQDGYQEQNVSE